MLPLSPPKGLKNENFTNLQLPPVSILAERHDFQSIYVPRSGTTLAYVPIFLNKKLIARLKYCGIEIWQKVLKWKCFAKVSLSLHYTAAFGGFRR